MKILFLGYKNCKLHNFLNLKYKVTQTMDKITPSVVKKFNKVVSFGYPHILKSDIINIVNSPIINLHISYLPYNRGCHPNFYSFLHNTPKGVTIHYIDEGIDTGNIILQKEINFPLEENTLHKTYKFLIENIQDLFISNYKDILNDKIISTPQKGKGTLHYKKELSIYKNILTEGWDTKINKIMMKNKKRTDLEIIDEVANIREKNNVNWMDILRLAFKHAPEDARKLMGRVNEYDGRISQLLKELSENG
mgnify:CR=1 FL=1|jgi:methionyl-tRNA formyltransferase|tara:strand:+ start:970 stop:1719 length:750 start_codon:yes stop_codon:yes gene_type:complete